MRSVVLDVRGAKGGPLQCRYLAPNPDTVASLYMETDPDADEEMEDSMGQLRTVSRRERFEMTLALQMYTLGFTAITLRHWQWYDFSVLENLTPAMQVLTGFFTDNKWHLQLFFAGAGSAP